MSGIRELVDVESLTVGLLNIDAGVVAVAGTDSVGTDLPPDLDEELPYLQLWRLPGTLVTDETQRLERARLQLASWGARLPAGRGDALDLARAACKALGDAVGSHDAGVVAAVDIEVSPYWSPDPETDTPRYLFVAALFVHP